jgi:APA family basic amino acid/polyamine antiporter
MNELKRSLGLSSTIAIVVGGVIGSGIFMKPALMASQLGSPLLLLSVWLVAGIITLFGALSNAEVATMFPETGGQYVFFQKMYGQGFAFLYGWASFAVINTAGNASIAYVCSQYTNYFFELPRFSELTERSVQLYIPLAGIIFPLENIGVKVLTSVLVILLSFINYRSVNYGAGLQRFLTALKAAAILLLIGGILFSGKGTIHHLTVNSASMPRGLNLLGACMASIAGAFWAYDGWNNITFVAGEIKNPHQVIPKSLFLGLSFCIAIYMLVNLAYIYVLPIGAIAGSAFIASDAALVTWGGVAGSVIAFMVIISTLGTANANILSTARVTFAMSRENKWFRRAGKVQALYGTPGNALILNMIWASVLIFSGSFDMLTDMLIFVSWFFYGMSALGIFILRKKMKEVERPYKVWGYPMVPAIFVLFTLFFLISTLYSDIKNYADGNSIFINSIFGLLITLIGIPVYYLSGKKLSTNE